MKSWLSEQIAHNAPLSFEGEYRRARQERVLITVGIVSYGRPELLQEILSCILPQLTSETELLVVLDGEDPDSLDTLQRIQNPGFRFVVHQENLGRPSARNRVVKEARGRYILWVDDDDLVHEDLVAFYQSLIKRDPTFDVANCDLELVELGNNKPMGLLSPLDYAPNNASRIQFLIAGKGLTNCGALVRRSLYRRVGDYDLRFDRSQDYDFWLRAAPVARFLKVPRTLVTYRRHSKGVSFSVEVDRSYESLAVRNCLQRITLEEIFPELDWQNDLNSALRYSLTYIARSLADFGDYYHAGRYLNSIPADAVTEEVVRLQVRIAFALGDLTAARFALTVARNSALFLKRSTQDELYGKILLYRKQLEALESGGAAARKAFYRNFGAAVPLLTQYAKLFEQLGDMPRARRYMRGLLRAAPNDNTLVTWFEQHSSPEELRQVQQLRARMLGSDPEAPLYHLARVEGPVGECRETEFLRFPSTVRQKEAESESQAPIILTAKKAKRVPLENIELHVTHTCNLSCSNCSHFSNYLHRGKLSVEEADEMLSIWSHRLAPTQFSMLGGEPTVHPDLSRIVSLGRKHFPDAERMILVSNGWFLERHPELPRVLAEDNITLHISIHHTSPEYMEKVERIREVVKRWQEDFAFEAVFRPSHDSWRYIFRGEGADIVPYEHGNPAESWRRCPSRACPQIHEGKLWKCPQIAYLPLMDKKFKLSEKWDPYLAYQPLEGDCTDEELEEFVNRKEESICGMCPAEVDYFKLPNPMRTKARKAPVAAGSVVEPLNGLHRPSALEILS